MGLSLKNVNLKIIEATSKKTVYDDFGENKGIKEGIYEYAAFAETYKIKFTLICQLLCNNIKIDFDKRGRWKSITANVSLPLEILPVQAREYLEANYPNQIVVEIDREGSGFEVTLQNRLDVHFAQDGSFLRVDSD